MDEADALSCLVSPDPVVSESKDPTEYKRIVALVAALERELAKALQAAGYPVLNAVSSKSIWDPAQLNSVLSAFADQYPELRHAAFSPILFKKSKLLIFTYF